MVEFTSVSDGVNYFITGSTTGLTDFVKRVRSNLWGEFDGLVKKVKANSLAEKKILDIATKLIGDSESAEANGFVIDAKGAVTLIGVYGLYRDIMFWINPFSKETFDDKALRQSLKDELKSEALAETICQAVMKEEKLSSKDHVREILKLQLQDHVKADEMAIFVEKVTVEQKARSKALIVAMACFTAVHVLGCIETLKKWGIIDLAKIAAQIGGNPVSIFVVKLTSGTVIGVVASIGVAILLGEAVYRTVKHGRKLYRLNNDPMATLGMTDEKVRQQREKLHKKLRSDVLDVISNGTDLIATVTPLLFVVSPPVAIALAVVAKGIGFICIIVK